MNMATILSLTTLLDSIATVTWVAWLLRITLLATLACMYLSLARRAQPALRHVIAAGSLLAVVLLPVASKLLPAVDVPVLRAPVVATLSTLASDPAPVTIELPSRETPAVVTVGAIDAGAAVPVVSAAARPQVATTPGLLARAISLVQRSFLSARNWIRFAIVIWMLVAAAMLVRLALAFARANRIAVRAPLITDEYLRVEIERACRALGVTRWIDIAASDEIAVPMVIGVAKPRIVLPVSAEQWTRDRLGVVLLHEIAHIRRRDCVSMLFARVVAAILWFHPLIVMLSRHVRRESERACDDLVLSTGVRGSDYAEHLVSIAKLSARRDPLASAALAFAARSTLEERVASILSGRSRATSPRMLGVVAGAFVALFLATAAVHPAASASCATSGHDNTYALSQQKQEKMQRKIENQIRRDIEKKQRVQSRIENQIQRGIQYRLAGDNDNDNDNENDGESWYDRAHSYYSRGQFEKAGRAYDNAAKFGYNRATAYYNAGCSWALAKQSGPALIALENAFEEGFDDLDMYASDEDLDSVRDDARFKRLMDKIMNSDEGQQQRRAASRDYDRLVAKKNVDDGDWSSVGIDLMRAGDYDRAATAFDNEFKRSKNQDEDAIYNKACARALQGKTDEALKLLEQSIATGSVSSEHMAEDEDLRSLHKSKKFDQLVDLAEDLELSYPGFTAESWTFNGKKVVKIGDYNDEKHWQKSLGHFKEVANKHPQIGRAWFNLGYAQLKSGDAVSCTPNFQKSLDMGYKPPTMMYNLACSTAQEGKIDVAFAWLDKSEKAGFEVWNSARWDEDLDPLRADPRWRELKKRWQEEERDHAEAHGVHIQFD
jgi:beta-lactamase regulating signal transducer with metallopeptidase domain/Flp pilus assembly protein TadD